MQTQECVNQKKRRTRKAGNERKKITTNYYFFRFSTKLVPNLLEAVEKKKEVVGL